MHAVTGACLLTRAEVFRQVGGFNESFPVNYNDIDYCLKVHTAGLRIVLAPQARLFHFESRTRARTVAAPEIDLFRRLWADITRSDPYYNPHLDKRRPEFRLKPAP